jgi:hypothetical protein
LDRYRFRHLRHCQCRETGAHDRGKAAIIPELCSDRANRGAAVVIAEFTIGQRVAVTRIAVGIPQHLLVQRRQTCRIGERASVAVDLHAREIFISSLHQN